MYGVELYAAVRLAVVDEGLSHHEAGRRFGIDRRTVKKMLSYSAPPGYRRTKPVRRPKLDGFTGIVDAILEADTDPEVPRKQRHTAHRIFERLRQRRRARPSTALSRKTVLAVRRLRSRRCQGRGDIHPDRHRQTQRCRSASLARRRARPHRRDAADPAGRTPPLELGSRAAARPDRLSFSFHYPLTTNRRRSSADGYSISLPACTAADASAPASRPTLQGSRRHAVGYSLRFAGLSPATLHQFPWRTKCHRNLQAAVWVRQADVSGADRAPVGRGLTSRRALACDKAIELPPHRIGLDSLLQRVGLDMRVVVPGVVTDRGPGAGPWQAPGPSPRRSSMPSPSLTVGHRIRTRLSGIPRSSH